MSFEYLIRADFPSRDAIDAILRTASGAAVNEGTRRFEFRGPGRSGEAPDATASIEQDGIRFRALSNQSVCVEAFGFIVTSAACFGEVRVIEIG